MKKILSVDKKLLICTVFLVGIILMPNFYVRTKESFIFTATVVWEYREIKEFYSSWGGDADRLPNGNTLITDCENGRILEVTKDGENVWEVFFDFFPDAPFDHRAIYRSERVPDLDLSNSLLYNKTGYDTPKNITVTRWDEEKACNGITFVMAWGDLWGINMMGQAIWKYKGMWTEQKFLPNNHLLLLSARMISDIIEIDLDGNKIFHIKANAHHDVIKPTENDLFYLSKIVSNINGTTYISDEIRQRHKGSVVWRWKTLEHIPINDRCSLCSKWVTHSNSITLRIENSRPILYLSVRNFNQIVKIDYTTKEIIWKLGENGDVRMFEKNGDEVTKLFSHQHDPEILPNGNILLFDNGLHRGTKQPYSRVIEIEIQKIVDK